MGNNCIPLGCILISVLFLSSCFVINIPIYYPYLDISFCSYQSYWISLPLLIQLCLAAPFLQLNSSKAFFVIGYVSKKCLWKISRQKMSYHSSQACYCGLITWKFKGVISCIELNTSKTTGKYIYLNYGNLRIVCFEV